MKKILASIAALLVFTLPLGANMVTAGATTPEVCTEVIHHDAVPAVTHTEVLPIQRYSYTGGVDGLDENGRPAQATAPGSDWQANTTEYNNGTSDGGHLGLYFVSNSSSGNGDWFYWATGVVVIVDVPEVPAYDETVEVDCDTETPPPCEQTEEGRSIYTARVFVICCCVALGSPSPRNLPLGWVARRYSPLETIVPNVSRTRKLNPHCWSFRH